MIAHLRGTIFNKQPDRVIVEAGGVGYDVAISISTFTSLAAEGSPVALYIHTQVREDAISLFGFTEINEKRLFEKLISVSGIGPKLAITALSGIAPDRLVAAIRAHDYATLTRIPGIGKKTAERAVLELKDRLDDLATAPAGSIAGPAGEDVLSAMVNLGYPRAAAQKAIESVIEKDGAAGRDFEMLFRAAMSAMR